MRSNFNKNIRERCSSEHLELHLNSDPGLIPICKSNCCFYIPIFQSCFTSFGCKLNSFIFISLILIFRYQFGFAFNTCFYSIWPTNLSYWHGILTHLFLFIVLIHICFLQYETWCSFGWSYAFETSFVRSIFIKGYMMSELMFKKSRIHRYIM